MSGTSLAGSSTVAARRAPDRSVPSGERIVVFYARIALSAAFLSALASRFGVWNGDLGLAAFSSFVEYTAEVNAFMPLATIPFLALAATVAELFLGVALLMNLWPRQVALGQRGPAGAVRDRHGDFLRDQVSVGLFGLLGLGRSPAAGTGWRRATRYGC